MDVMLDWVIKNNMTINRSACLVDVMSDWVIKNDRRDRF